MRRLFKTTPAWMSLVLAGLLAGCSSGNNPPADGGSDGDGGQVECTTAVDCDDGNECTDDSCVAGKCSHTNNDSPCDDGQQCSTNDHCVNGVCVGESSMNCDDNNPCTEDSCDDAQGCIHVNNHAPCDDGNACTVGEMCNDGQCGGGEPLYCDDGNECTDDSCDPARGCVYSNNSNSCDDGQACSTNDRCVDGVCKGDSNVDCDDHNICTTDRCDDSLGCVHINNAAACDDGNACTDNDQCHQGLCRGEEISCDDDNVCTTDRCDAQTGCTHENNSDPCDDGNACTAGDTCSGGQCQPGGSRDCDDGNDCTDDSCEPSLGCIHNNNTASCDDGNPCTDGDHCQGGQCVGGSSQFDCDDGNPCTDDSCDPQAGCSHDFNNAACDDGDACTMNDVCGGGRCQGVPLDADGDGAVAAGCPGGDDCCDSGSESITGCTAGTAGQINPGVFEGSSNGSTCSDGLDNDCDGLADSADPGCQTCSVDGDCDDGNVCNGDETCSGGSCQPGTALDCDDNNICTTDSCDSTSGCQHQPNTLFCDDGNACTVGDQCSGGTCQPGSDTLDCDDGNDCTVDSCSAGSGCQHNPVSNGNPCDDGDPCTGNDTCQNGVCQPGSGAPDCDDDNPCTTDDCLSGQGCTHTDVGEGTPCDDGNACTENDQCQTGLCRGTTLACSDGNPCTTDGQCDPQSGCVYPPDDSASCTAADPCIVNDHCENGFCTGDPQDQDNDGHGDEACGGDDCDDNHADTYPGAPELCGDDRDNNCNFLTDENCSGCTTVDPSAELVIDSDAFGGAYGFDAADEGLSLFVVEPLSYTVIQAKAAFFDFACGSGGDQGNYSVHVYADDNGQPGAELASSAVQTVDAVFGDPNDCQNTQETAWATFTLTNPVTFSQGQAFWVGVRSQDQEADGNNSGDLFLPVFSPPVLMPYLGSVLKAASDGQYYLTGGNWMLRVEGCGDGPWLELATHTNAAVLQPGQSSSVTVELRNRGFADAAAVAGTLTCDEAEMVVTSDSADFGNIAQGASASGSPAFSVQPDAGAYGIYPMSIGSSAGTGTWQDGFGLYIQGTGCSQENHNLTADSGNAKYIVPLSAGDMMGNYFIVDSTSFTMTSIDAQFYHIGSAPSSYNVRAKVYSYRNGEPDQLLWQGNWEAASADTHNFTLSQPITLKKDNLFFVMIESQSDMSCPDQNNCFAILTDDGLNPSLNSGLIWDNDQSTWNALGLSAMITPKGCQATELRYDSHTASPASPSPGDSVSLTITLANDGAIDASNVTATLSSADPDVTVTQDSGSYGTIAAGQTKSASGYQVSIAGNADQFQYLLDLDITDGTNHWNDSFPLRLAGGEVDLTFSEFTTSLAGNDIHYHFVVTNQGNVDCVTPFRVDLYIDRETAPATGQDGDWNQGYDGLAMGASETVDLVLNDASPGDYSAWVQCDTLAAVVESDESNNVDGPSNQTVGTTDVFELLDPPRRWFAQDMPVGYRFVAGNSQPGMPAGEDRNAFILGFQHWQDVTTATITFTQLSDTSSGGFNNYDGYNTMTFNDPDGDLGTGTLGATIPVYTQSQSVVVNGVTFYRMTDADIVINDGVAFGTNAEAASGSCWSNPVTDLEGVATHEIGHLLGLDHPDVSDATMYYAIGQCDPTRVTLEQSDINGVTFIYPQ